MIYFFADNHYSTSPGKNIWENLPAELKNNCRFYEDDWDMLESGEWLKDCRLLVLDMIGGTCGQPHPGDGAEKAVSQWCRQGGNVLLLHGSSAAFWQWGWWRDIVGFRWVRPGDPDGVDKSVHPIKNYSLRKCKVRHLLAEKLLPVDFPEDEIYTELEQVTPVTVLMDTVISEGCYPQCFETTTPWNGKMLSFLPGHRAEVCSSPEYIRIITLLTEYLLEK